jgi:hypothetical protein
MEPVFFVSCQEDSPPARCDDVITGSIRSRNISETTVKQLIVNSSYPDVNGGSSTSCNPFFFYGSTVAMHGFGGYLRVWCRLERV